MDPRIHYATYRGMGKDTAMVRCLECGSGTMSDILRLTFEEREMLC
jgi:hypothetical protein